MEVRHRVTEFNTTPRYEKLKQELERLSIPFKLERLGTRPSGQEWLSLECVISEDHPLFPNIATLIERHGFHSQIGVYFTDEEVQSAEWVWATAGEYQYPEPGAPDYLAATYDLANYCHLCGIGAVQNRPFRLRSDFRQKSSQFLGLHWAFDVIFVRPQTKRLLENAGISGVDFRHPILHRSGEPITSVYQMHIAATSRPGLALQSPFLVTCKPNNEESHARGLQRLRNRLAGRPHCHRVKYHHPRREPITLRRDALEDLPDIALSYEYFGSGGGASHLVLVRRNVVALANAYRLKGLRFTPIIILP